MTDARQRLGRAGEEIPARFLAGHGYVILARNRRSKGGEIDIVARDPGGDVVFVEVRTRRGGAAPDRGLEDWALESVSAAKQQRLLDGAAAYLAEHPDPDGAEPAARIDVIAVAPGPRGHLAVARHITNAVEA